MRPKPNEPDFVEALARGLKVISAFSLSHLALSVSDVAAATKLARPTTRRLLLTLESLGYVRVVNGMYMLTPKVLELGTAYISAQGMWDIARPHLEALVEKTKESSSLSQLVGSDIVYTAFRCTLALDFLRMQQAWVACCLQTCLQKNLMPY